MFLDFIFVAIIAGFVIFFSIKDRKQCAENKALIDRCTIEKSVNVVSMQKKYIKKDKEQYNVYFYTYEDPETKKKYSTPMNCPLMKKYVIGDSVFIKVNPLNEYEFYDPNEERQTESVFFKKGLILIGILILVLLAIDILL